MSAHSGVSWLSYRGNAPVLPIGFSSTKGALGSAMKFKRPKISMHVGRQISPASPAMDIPRKKYLKMYAERVMGAIQAMIPKDQRQNSTKICDERFELVIDVLDCVGKSIDLPAGLKIIHDKALTKVLHRPGILKIFSINLELPTLALETLDKKPEPHEIEIGTRSILNYLKDENPYLLSYRFGPKEAESMQNGLEELNSLAAWVSQQGYKLKIIPIRRYHIDNKDEEIIQTTQGDFKGFM